jgi:hypothetical protein
MRKPPYIKFFVKDFAFDIHGMSDKQLGVYLKSFVLAYKTGEIPKKYLDDSLFKSLNEAFTRYEQVCERNKNNRNKTKTYSDQSSTSGQPVVDVPLTTLVKPKPEPEPEPEPVTYNKEYKESFDQFWAVYPKRKAKQAAIKAYKKARQSVSHEKIMEGVRQYELERRGKDPTYTANPATWLNGGRWDDDITKPNGQENSKQDWINWVES